MGERSVPRGISYVHAARTCAALLLFLVGSFFLVAESNAMSVDDSAISQRLPVSMKQSFNDARSRIRNWQSFIDDMRRKSEADVIPAVNAYINSMHFVDDANLWEKSDYWATPLQMLAAGAGDCEDFAIAKYFTLKALGISEDHLRITYVWHRDMRTGIREPHMVLTYTATESHELLVLDILTNDIRPLTQHQEMEPVYGINSNGLWLVGDNSQLIAAGNPTQLPQWRNLIQEIESDSALLQIQ